MRIAKIQQTVNYARLSHVFRHCAIALLLAALVSACATTAKPAVTDIKQRAQARWDALLKGDYDTAYGFYSPGYRSAHSRVDFEIAVRSRRVRWTSAEVKESSCKADVCKIKTRVGYAVAGALPGVPVWKSKQDMQENWVRTDGQWWYLPDD
jgi:hypothetical protein